MIEFLLGFTTGVPAGYILKELLYVGLSKR